MNKRSGKESNPCSRLSPHLVPLLVQVQRVASALVIQSHVRLAKALQQDTPRIRHGA